MGIHTLRLIAIAAIINLVMPYALLYAGDTTPNVNLFPDERAIIQFHFTEPPMSEVGPVDFIWNLVGGSFTNFHEGSYIDYFLYDQDTLLSSHRTDQTCCLYHAPGSLIANNASVEINFDSIIDGSIQGTLIMEPTFVDPNQYSMIFTWFDILSGTATGSGSYWNGPDAVITDCKIETSPFGDGFENDNGHECIW